MDLHTHSSYSDDSLVEPDDIVRIARERGLDGVAVTDHLTGAGGFQALSHAAPGFLVIPGVEYPTEEGHVVGLFIQREPAVPPLNGAPALPLDQVVAAIHAAGGIAVLAHPFESRKQLPERLFEESGLDAIECFNARAGALRNPRANAQAREYARKNGIPAAGGSDAHFAWEIGRGGCVIGELGSGATLDQVREAILDRRAVPFGRPSSRIVVPLTGLVKMWKSRRYNRAPRILLRLMLAALGALGRRIEDLIRGPLDG